MYCRRGISEWVGGRKSDISPTLAESSNTHLDLREIGYTSPTFESQQGVCWHETQEVRSDDP